MRSWKYVAGFLIFEAMFVDGALHLFPGMEDARTGRFLVAFGVAQFALVVAFWWGTERELNRGKNKSAVRRETERRSQVLAFWSTGLIYMFRMSFGIYRLATQGWSWSMAGILLVWTVGVTIGLYALYPKMPSSSKTLLRA